jgi:hypothetical protein
VSQIKGLEPTLLPRRECDEETEFRKFRRSEVGVEVVPQRVVGEVCVPDDGIGIAQRSLLPIGVPGRGLEL